MAKKFLSAILSLLLVLGTVAAGGMSALADGESVANYGTPRGSYICQYRLGDTYGDHWSGSYILIEYLNYTLKLGRVNPNPDPSTMRPYEPTDPDSMEKGYILFPAMCDDPYGYDIEVSWVNGGYATDDEVVFDLSFPDGSNLHVEKPVTGCLGTYHVNTTPGESTDYEVFKVAAEDSMLDGWTGGAIEIYQEGRSEPFTRVVNNDGEARTENDILLPRGYSYRFDWVYDRNNSECSVEVTDNNGLTYSAVDPINGPLWAFDVPYEIGDAANLRAFADNVNNRDRAGFDAVLTADIDLVDEPFTPIGTYEHPYEGTFDGDGHIITGLTYNSSADYAGLFGYVGSKTEGGVTTKGTVKNVGLVGGAITGRNCVGGVVGYNNGGSITNCYNTGAVSGNDFVGGVIGLNYGTVTGCYNTGAVSGNINVGGVVGYNLGTTSNCYNTSAVSGSNYVGGVIGKTDGAVTNCYNTGEVFGTGIYIGGVAGCNKNKNNYIGSLKNCYNTSAVSGSNYVGGVVGYNYNSTTSNCYNTGNVLSSGTRVGGIAGSNEGINGLTAAIKNCYIDANRVTEVDIIGHKNGEGAIDTNVSGLTTAQMTGENALRNMVFEYGDGEVSPWQIKANGADVSGKYYLFYPHLKGFNFNDDLTQMTADEIEAADWPAKLEASVTWSGEDSYIYNGTEQAPAVTNVIICDKTLDPGADYTVSYKVKSDDIWKDASEPVNAGEYKAIVTFTDTGYLKGQPPIEKAFNIDPKPVAVTACGPDGPIKAYNGQEQSYTGSVIWIYDREETGLDDSKLRYTGNTTVTGTDAGRHSVDLSAEYCFCDDSNYDVTFTAEGDFDFDIAQSVLTITADDVETDFGEDLAGLTYKIESRFGSYYNIDELGITLSTDADKNKAGTYDITVTVPDNPNYLITTQKGTYTVRQIDPGATVTAEDVDYGQKAVVTFTVPADASGKVTFYLDAADTGITKDIENGQAVCEFEKLNIGSHDVECVYTGDGNYNPGETKTADFEVKSVDCPLTINYVYADGSEAAETFTDNVAIFTQYSVTSPGITGYTPDTATVEGAMGDDDMDGKTVTVTYTANTYTATFVDENGETVKEVKFTVEDDSIDEPAVPGKEGYEGKWSEYTLALSDIEIAAEYTAIEYTATFVDENGETVAEIPYTVETEKLEAPAVPGKQGYAGEWEDYELTPGGITVKPVYTPADICPLDNEYHGTSFWGRLVKLFHTVIWKAFNLVGINIYLKIW